MQWLRNIIFKWLELVYGEEYIRQDHVRKNFTQFLYHAYTHARIEQLFEIIIGIKFTHYFSWSWLMVNCCFRLPGKFSLCQRFARVLMSNPIEISVNRITQVYARGQIVASRRHNRGHSHCLRVSYSGV